jgi:hypothetical protein
MTSSAFLCAVVMAIAACAAAPPPLAPARRLGDAMDEAGRRFQRAGRAVIAGRWELATYDLHELEEIFEQDLASSSWLGNPELARLAYRFQTKDLASLHNAVLARDLHSFEEAAASAAKACNECHKRADQGYIEISASLGAELPTIEITTTGASATR